MLFGPKLLTPQNIQWLLQNWFEPIESGQIPGKPDYRLVRLEENTYVESGLQQHLQDKENTEAIVIKQYKYLKAFIASLSEQIEEKKKALSQKGHEASSLYEHEQYISALHGLEVLGRNIHGQLQGVVTRFEKLAEAHSQQERMLSALATEVARFEEQTRLVAVSQKFQLCQVEQHPGFIFDPILGLQQAQLCRLISRGKKIGETAQYGGIEVKAFFNHKFGQSGASFTHAPVLQATLTVKLHFREDNSTLTFKLGQFWPRANLPVVYNQLKAEVNFVFAVLNFLIGGAPDDKIAKLSKQPYDDIYLESILSGSQLKENPALLLLLPSNFEDATGLKYRMACQVAVEMAYNNCAMGVYMVTESEDLLNAHALGFQQKNEYTALNLDPSETPKAPLDTALADRLREKLTANPIYQTSPYREMSEEDSQFGYRVLYMGVQDMMTRPVHIEGKTETTTWEKLCRTKPLLFRDRRGMWPNLKGLSPQPDIDFQAIQKRALTGKYPSTQDFCCTPIQSVEIFSEKELKQRGRLGVQQFSIAREGEEGQAAEVRVPENPDSPFRTWRLK